MILRELGDELILRHATPADAEALARFNAEMHHEPGQEGEPNEPIGQWTLDLMRGTHPRFQPADFMVVEDTSRGNIVSALNLISQRWSYGGIEFGVGRPELVSTHPDYRRRGLIRTQMELVHQWSAERGEMVQVITGIPWYYRQFGYEMGLELAGLRSGYLPHVPTLGEGKEEPYQLRPAKQSDLAFIADCYDYGRRRYLVSTLRDRALWEYELRGRSPSSVQYKELFIIEKADGEPVGFLTHQTRLWRQSLSIIAYELKPGISWLAVTPSVLRYLKKTGEGYQEESKEPFGAITFFLGTEHPVYQAIPERLPRKPNPYAYYVRVPDLPGFLRLIAPVLEQRLAQSIAVGHTGEVQLNFYRTGLRLLWEHGRLIEVEPWQPGSTEDGNASFPDLSFLHLLFGHRSLAELRAFYPDCWADEEGHVLLSILFPKQPSHAWPIS